MFWNSRNFFFDVCFIIYFLNWLVKNKSLTYEKLLQTTGPFCHITETCIFCYRNVYGCSSVKLRKVLQILIEAVSV